MTRTQKYAITFLATFLIIGAGSVSFFLLHTSERNDEGETQTDSNSSNEDEESVKGKSTNRDDASAEINSTVNDLKNKESKKVDIYLPPEEAPVEDPGDSGSPDQPAVRDVAWGVYTGWQVSDVQNFQAKVGGGMSYLASFVHWGNENEFPTELAAYAKTNGMTPVIYWEAMDYNYPNANDARFSYDAITRGDWDAYILSFAQRVAAYGNPVIIVLFEEMNSDWYPWSGMIDGNSAAKHVLAYRHVRDIFRYTPNAQFAWTVNNDSVPDVPANTRLAYYPGDNYVDYVGVNGFNFDDPWQTFSEVFNTALADVSTLGKPVMIFSMACSDGSQKAAWIRDALTVQIPSHESVVGWIWFNEDKEQNWLVWSDEASLTAFKEGVSR